MLVAGFILAVVFQANHCTVLIDETDSDLRKRFDAKSHTARVVAGTLDVAPHSRLRRTYLGELNVHVEHHLGHGSRRSLDSRSVPNYAEAVRAHFRYLKVLGAK
jgi:hypothetical protein